MSANVNALVVNESDEAMHEVENGNKVEVENVLVNTYNHDRESETLMIGAQRDRQANVSRLCTERLAKTDFVVESYDACAVRHAQLRPFIERDRTHAFPIHTRSRSLSKRSAICRCQFS